MARRVLIFSLAYFPKHVGGAEVAIKAITDRIPSSDIEFHMVCLRFDSTLPKVEKVGNVLVHRIGFTRPNPSMSDLGKFPLHLNKFFFQFTAAFTAMRLHRQYHYDAIWAMMAHACGVPAALFKLFNPRVPYVLTLQEGDEPRAIERKMLILWPLFSRAFKSADVVTAISTFLGTWARRRGFKGRLEVVPNAADTKHFSQEFLPATLDALKDLLDKKMGDVFLVTTSRLVYKNAIDDVIRALRELPANIRFIILGTGPDEEKLRRLAKKLGVLERVTFLGFVEHEEMPKYLKVSDIFIRPSRSEGMGASFVEAMAAGLPVIATQEGGLADFLFDPDRNRTKAISNGVGEKRPGASTPEYKTGWAVDKDSPREIATAVKDVMAHPEKVRAVTRTAKEMVIEKYDWNVIARDMKSKAFDPLFS